MGLEKKLEKFGHNNLSLPEQLLFEHFFGLVYDVSHDDLATISQNIDLLHLFFLSPFDIEGHWYLGSIKGDNVSVDILLVRLAAIATIIACLGQYNSLKEAAVSFVADVQWVVESIYLHAPFEVSTVEFDTPTEENSLHQLQLYFDRRRLGLDDSAGLDHSDKTTNNLIESVLNETNIKWDDVQ